MSNLREINERIAEYRLKQANLSGKEEMINKYSEKVKETSNILSGLEEHMKNQTESIQKSTNIYIKQMKIRDEKAKLFCQDKNIDELKEYLANSPVAYNFWKNADLDTLKALIMNVYEEY